MTRAETSASGEFQYIIDPFEWTVQRKDDGREVIIASLPIEWTISYDWSRAKGISFFATHLKLEGDTETLMSGYEGRTCVPLYLCALDAVNGPRHRGGAGNNPAGKHYERVLSAISERLPPFDENDEHRLGKNQLV